MKLNFKFRNLCGIVYKQGNVVFTPDGNGLLSPVGHRVTYFDLVNNASFTFPFETNGLIQRISLSPTSSMLVAIDSAGKAVFVNFYARTVIHQMGFGEPVHGVVFSPNEKFVAVLFDRKLQIWHVPPLEERQLTPLILYKTIAGHRDAIISADWSADSQYLVTASKDMTARILRIKDAPGWKDDSFFANHRNLPSCNSNHQDLDKDERDSWVPIVLAGHRHPLIGAYFNQCAADDAKEKRLSYVFTIGRDGTICRWDIDLDTGKLLSDKATERHVLSLKEEENKSEQDDLGTSEAKKLSTHEYRPKIASIAFERDSNLLTVGFVNGTFGLFKINFGRFDLNGPQLVYALGLGTAQSIDTCAINRGGEWLAFGSSTNGQLLVWEWRSESYILRQQGHSDDLAALDFSSDGQVLATGGKDGKVKLWSVATGYCFSTFSEHDGAVNGVAFTPNGKVLLSAGSDGTVRAYDLVRHRAFRTMTCPSKTTQLSSLAVDPTGELVAAGTFDTFEIIIWSLQTGRLVEVLSGHTGPVIGITFDPVGRVLASASWDRTVKIWDVYSHSSSTQTLEHSSDVLGIAFRHDGQELAAATLGGSIVRWDPEQAQIVGTIECSRDIRDRPLSEATLASISYSTDGSAIFAAGSFPWVGVYQCNSALLLRRFFFSNLYVSKDKKRMGHVTVEEQDQLEQSARIVKTCATGRGWGALTMEGLLIYGLDDQIQFDPFDLEINLTPETVEKTLAEKNYLKALVLALRLNVPTLLIKVWEEIPEAAIPLVTRDMPPKHMPALLRFLACLLDQSPQSLPVLLEWINCVIAPHALLIKNSDPIPFAPSLRILYRATVQLYRDLKQITNENTMLLLTLREKVQSG